MEGSGIMEKIEVVICCIITMILTMIVTASIMSAMIHDNWRKECIARGHAEYVLDGDQTEWQWKDE